MQLLNDRMWGNEKLFMSQYKSNVKENISSHMKITKGVDRLNNYPSLKGGHRGYQASAESAATVSSVHSVQW